MAATLTGKTQMLIDMTQVQTVAGQSTSGNFGRTQTYSWASGTGAGQVDKIYSLGAQSIAASGTLDVDLAGTVLDIYGVAVTFVRVKGVIVIADSGNTNNVVVGAAAANQWPGPFGAVAHTVHVRPGGLLAMIAPGTTLDSTLWPVTAGTGDLLRFTNSAAGTAVVFDLLIIGCSA